MARRRRESRLGLLSLPAFPALKMPGEAAAVAVEMVIDTRKVSALGTIRTQRTQRTPRTPSAVNEVPGTLPTGTG
jgi:hypothetical protein